MSARQRKNWTRPLDPERWPGVTHGHYDICLAVARRVAAKTRLDAEDLAQAAIAYVLRVCGEWDGRRRGYLWTAARWGVEREARRLLRRGSRAANGRLTLNENDDETPLGELAVVKQDELDADLSRHEAAELVRAALKRARPRDRALLRERFFEGLLYREIAARHRTTTQNVVQRVQSALRRLRPFLPRGLALAG